MLYGLWTPGGPGPAKFGKSGNFPARLWAYQAAGVEPRVMWTTDYSIRNHALESVLKLWIDTAWGDEWVSKAVLREVLADLRSLGDVPVHLWTPRRPWRAR